MKRTNVIAMLLGGTLIGLSGVTLAEMDVASDAMLALQGEWELGNGETHLIAHSKKDETYRICVRQARNAVPVKVIYDGKEQTVATGNCADFEAMNIKLTPAGKLEKDIVLMGRYHRLHS